MNICCIIPARFASSRLPGKPLTDFHGRPMIWWVYNQAVKVKEFSSVVAAIDDQRVADVCEQYGINYVMTGEHGRLFGRLWEVSNYVKADCYVCINGDEPLITPDMIRLILPKDIAQDEPVMYALMKPIKDPVELMDTANIKVVVNKANEGIMVSRSPIPYPYKSVMFEYKKTVGIQCYNKALLDFFVNTPETDLERIEDLALLRFIENGIKIRFKYVFEESLSVDTIRDVEKVRQIMKDKADRGELVLPQ